MLGFSVAAKADAAVPWRCSMFIRERARKGREREKGMEMECTNINNGDNCSIVLVHTL